MKGQSCEAQFQLIYLKHKVCTQDSGTVLEDGNGRMERSREAKSLP